MNKKQYNNVIEYTLTHETNAQCSDSLKVVRAIFNNMRIALPNGDIGEVYETIKTNDYMGWRSCTMQEVQAAANNGTAAIGISKDRIAVLSANDEEQPVTQTASVMTLDENTSAFVVEGMQYYSYSYGTTDQCGSGSTDTFHYLNTKFNFNNRTALLNELIAIMGNRQDAISHYTTTESVDIILNYDNTITKFCNMYCVPKEFVQTLLLRELWCVDVTDTVSDEAVELYFSWKTEYEYWAQMPTWQQVIISPPTPPLYMQEDSSTGIGQMFAWVAINAHNLAINKGLINASPYNSNDWHDCEYVWKKLHNDDSFAIKMTTLEIHHCADYAGVSGSLFHCTATQIKAILSRYNGTGTDAQAYGNECYEYYKVFKKYS